MGSIRIAAVVGALAMLPAAAGAAGAATPEEARPVAEQFLRALIAEDAVTACSLLAARHVAAFGSVDACSAGLFRPMPDNFDDYFDRSARSTLDTAFEASRVAALDRASGRFPTPAKKLSLALRSLLPLTQVFIGTGPQVVRDTDDRAIGIDRVRSNATRVVLYVESNSGTIFRLVGGLRGKPRVAVAGEGVPIETDPGETSPPPQFELTSRVVPDGPEAAFVMITATAGGETGEIVVRMVVEAGAWKVDAVYADFVLSLIASATGEVALIGSARATSS